MKDQDLPGALERVCGWGLDQDLVFVATLSLCEATVNPSFSSWDSVFFNSFTCFPEMFKIIKGDSRFESTSKKKHSYGESYCLSVENMLRSS